jgi:hypothetical protein
LILVSRVAEEVHSWLLTYVVKNETIGCSKLFLRNYINIIAAV